MDFRVVHPPSVSVATFVEHAGGALKLELCAGAGGLERTLARARIQKPGLALAGYTRFVHRDRVQIFGETEISYLKTLSEDGQSRALDGYLRCEVACILVTKGLPLPGTLAAMCDAYASPLFRTKVTSSVTIRKVLGYLDDLLCPRCSVHGTLVDVNGVGVLMTGDSGIGKSETALDLVERGHRLVADDVVEIRRRGEDLVGQASRLIQNLIEIRGLGILDVAELFGVAATREHKRIELHIELANWSRDQVYDRTGLEERTQDILGINVRSIVLPVRPGRNIAGIVEVAARSILLRLRGHHAARRLSQALNEVLLDTQKHCSDRSIDLASAARVVEATDHIEDEVE
ncbi:MAG: HPr(Ser) kinase/phosphatase [Myxococcales bacterium]|nr:HPr(Ser) kinase/phosphatase [Myxococcales bacterium]